MEKPFRDDLNFMTNELNINRSALVRGLLLDWMVSRKMVFQLAEKEPADQALKAAIAYPNGDK